MEAIWLLSNLKVIIVIKKSFKKLEDYVSNQFFTADLSAELSFSVADGIFILAKKVSIIYC